MIKTSNLFDSFKDHLEKITPQLADDWRISKTKANNKMKISSEILNVYFDIPVNSFFDDLLRLNISLVGNSLTGSYIFSRDRHIFSEMEYYEWEDAQELKNTNSFKKSDLIAGELYKFDNGTRAFYLGYRYIIKRKDTCFFSLKPIINPDDYTKCVKTHIFAKENGDGSMARNKKHSHFLNPKDKIVSYIDKYKLSIEEIETKIESISYFNKFIFCDDYMVYDPIIRYDNYKFIVEEK